MATVKCACGPGEVSKTRLPFRLFAVVEISLVQFASRSRQERAGLLVCRSPTNSALVSQSQNSQVTDILFPLSLLTN